MFHVKHGWAEAAASLGVVLPEGVTELLERYHDLLRDGAVARGMIARADRDRIRERHIADALRGVPLLGTARTLVDLGSGAGLPGIPIALARPDLRVTLVEERRGRAAFLEAVVDELRLGNLHVHAGPADRLTGLFDAAAARAFADPTRAWAAAAAILVPEGFLLYWAGTSFDPQRDVPAGVAVSCHPASALANAGPVVIMARQ
jgi:16S rRNA (guanine527-N7)-methyltransferase